MADGISIPGRTIFFGATLYTDWVQRGGDCVLVRGDLLQLKGLTSIDVAVETRSEEDTVATSTTATQSLSLTSTGTVFTGLWQADSANTASKGVREQLRLKITTAGGASAGDFGVLRLFAPLFFDNSKVL